MKFATIASLLACSVAANISKLDEEYGAMETHQWTRRASGVSVIEEGLYNISNATVALGKDIQGFTVQGLFSLQAANSKALSSITTATSVISKIDPISVSDAVPLTAIIQQLAMVTEQSVNITIAKKSAFGGVVPVVHANLMQQLNASNFLTLTIGTKLPKSLLAYSTQSSAPIVAALNRGISVFSTPDVNTPQNSPELFSQHSAASPAYTVSVMSATAAALVVFAVLI